MTSISKTEIRNKLINDLKTGDNKTIVESINKLREKGHVSDIKILFDLLINNNNIRITGDCIELISDIKDKSVSEELISCLKDTKYSSIKKIIIEICWNTQINMSEHLNVFVDHLIKENFEVAFEAFTVIENMTGNISDEIKQEQTNKLKEAIAYADDTNKTFIHESIHIINNISAK